MSRRGAILAALLAAIFLAGPGRARAQNLFDLRGRAAESAVATLDHHRPDEISASAMLARLDGVVGRLDAAQVKALRACIDQGAAKIDAVDDGPLLHVLHLRAGRDTLTVEIRRTPAGLLVARRGSLPGEPGASEGRIQRLDEDRFFRLTRNWSSYRGEFSAAADDAMPGQVRQIPPVHGPVTFTKELLGDRLLRGRKTRVDGVTRVLDEVELWARAPIGYDPREQAGLLVWVSASPNGRPPEAIFSAADELGLVCVSPADAGNDCPIADRYQRIFDAVASASARFHVDPRRVYITGISGGGKVSSVLWACFPDLFSGSVPIVGLACYENIPIGNGQTWPGLYDKPKPPMFSLLKGQRCAAITGPKDFNYDSIIAAQKVLARDDLDARVFEHADLAHTMPTPEQFTQALRWVDEPWRSRRAKERADAERLLAEFQARAGREPPLADDERLKLLTDITAAGPWTPAAWEAARLLGKP